MCNLKPEDIKCFHCEIPCCIEKNKLCLRKQYINYLKDIKKTIDNIRKKPLKYKPEPILVR